MPEPTNIELIISKLQLQQAADEAAIVVCQNSISQKRVEIRALESELVILSERRNAIIAALTAFQNTQE